MRSVLPDALSSDLKVTLLRFLVSLSKWLAPASLFLRAAPCMDETVLGILQQLKVSDFMLQDCRKCTDMLNSEVHGIYEAASMAEADFHIGPLYAHKSSQSIA